jgi:cytochrome P450
MARMTELLSQVSIDEAEDASRRARFPAGASLTFADLEEAGHEPALDRLRSAEPVSWVPALGGWLATGYEAARTVLAPRTGLTVEAHENLVRASLGHMMLTSDADDHTRQRAPFERPFRMREVEGLFAEAVRSELDALLEAIAPAGECELGQALAAPFAIRMTGRVLGLSLDDVAKVDRFYDSFANGMVYDGNPERQRRADAARDELNAILESEFARCRRDRDASITSAVVNDEATTLADDEIASQLRVIMFGGIETIQSGIMNTTLLLLRHPDQLAELRADGGLLPNAIEESLRLIPPVSFMERWTPHEIQLGGVGIGPGEFIGVSALAANRDPAVFDDPLTYDMHRENARRHLSFSFGEHFCLGAHLARLELRAAMERLIALPGLRLIAVEEPAGFAFRRPPALHLAWD